MKNHYIISALIGGIAFLIVQFFILWDGAESSEKQKIDLAIEGCYLRSLDIHNTQYQYFNSQKSTLFYKAIRADGAFGFHIECDNWVKSIIFPEILWNKWGEVFPLGWTWATHNFSYTYNWQGSFNQSIDVLQAFSSINENKWLSFGKGFQVVYKNLDEKSITFWWDTLFIQPDGKAPTIWEIFIDQNDIENQFLNHNYITYEVEERLENIYELNTSYEIPAFKFKVFGANHAQKIVFPEFQDHDSWLASYIIEIEKSDDKNKKQQYIMSGSTVKNNFQTLKKHEIIHDFSDVTNQSDFQYDVAMRIYDWDMLSIWLDGEETRNKVCDMVNNCIYIPNKDFHVVANTISVEKSSFRSMSWSTVQLQLLDQYGNYITPVMKTKALKLILDKSMKDSLSRLYDANDSNLMRLLSVNTHDISFTLSFVNYLDEGQLSIEADEFIWPAKLEILNLWEYSWIKSGTYSLDFENMEIKRDIP